MESVGQGRNQYIEVWFWLVALLAGGLAVMALPVPKLAALALIFGIATIKAALVMRHYMHLKSESLFIIAVVLTPVLLFIGLAIALIPDIAMHR